MTDTTNRAGGEVFRLTLGDRIRKARKHALLDPDELAGKLGVSTKTIARWERDESEPRVSDAARIAQVTGVEFIDLCAPWELNPQPAEYRGDECIDLDELDDDDLDDRVLVDA